MNNPPEDERDRAARVHQARQILAGPDIEPPDDPIDFGFRDGLFSPGQLTYLLALAGLLVIALLLFAIWGFGVASVVFFLLALGLLGGWFVF